MIGKWIACVEGMLADAAAKLDDVLPGLSIGETDCGQFNQIAEHGEEMPGVDSVGARLWGRLFFHCG